MVLFYVMTLPIELLLLIFKIGVKKSKKSIMMSLELLLLVIKLIKLMREKSHILKVKPSLKLKGQVSLKLLPKMAIMLKNPSWP